MAGASTERETLLLPDEDVIINCQMSSSPHDGYGHVCAAAAAAIVSSESGTLAHAREAWPCKQDPASVKTIARDHMS